MSTSSSALFNLLPAVYRIRDAEIAASRNFLTADEVTQLNALLSIVPPLNEVDQQLLDRLRAKAARGPLESILSVVEEQLSILAENLDQLYDDQFIETCAPWVIPYIGDLIGYQSVNGIAPSIASPRAEVAHTISFRRRKGTVLVMEQLARNVTAWGAHAVEFFLRLGDTQYMNHIRLDNLYAPNLRHWEPREYQNTGFDETAHTIDVRRIAIGRGRYNIQNIGIFLWSLNSYSLAHAPLSAVPGQAQCFRFSSLGRDMPLFNLPVSQGVDITDPATPLNVPARLRRRVLCRDLTRITVDLLSAQYYGEGLSLTLYDSTGAVIPAQNICSANLSGPDSSWNNLPAPNAPIAIDPELGRIAVPTSHQGDIFASWHYGFNAPIGGGEYSRIKSFTGSAAQAVAKVPKAFATIHDALASLTGDGVVEITDSGIYSEPGGLAIAVSGHIELRAADGCRPTLLLGKPIVATGGDESILEINGLLIAWDPSAAAANAMLSVPDAADNQLTQLNLRHITFTPGWTLNPDGSPNTAFTGLPTVSAEIAGLAITVEDAILGALWVNGQSTASVMNSVIDATDPSLPVYVASIDSTTKAPASGGSLTLNGCTVIGKVHAALLELVSNSIIWAELTAADSVGTPPLWKSALWADRRQEGCVRFSYLPENAITPRRFQCITRARNVDQPIFYSLRYGDPDYAKLDTATPDSIRRGADDGGEMGVFHFLLNPLRESDLKIRLREYLPVGLEFGVIYQN